MKNIVEELKALADPTRLRILSLLWTAGDLCSCEIEAILDIRQSNASRHLSRLRTAGFLDAYKKAQWTHYRIASRHQGANTLAWQIILAARESLSSCINDIEKLEDYRKRGFSCVTIQQWIPFEGAAGSDRSRE